MRDPKNYELDGDKTLLELIGQAQLYQHLLMGFDLLIPLFLDGDIKELKQTFLPSWWWIVAVVAHFSLAYCFISYLKTAEKYLCFYRPAPQVRKMTGAKRQAEYRKRNQLLGIVGWTSAIMLLMASFLPHLLTLDDPLIMLGAGLIVFKTTTIVSGLQLMFFLVGRSEINRGLAEWKELRKVFPRLSFKRYALHYDGYDESIE